MADQDLSVGFRHGWEKTKQLGEETKALYLTEGVIQPKVLNAIESKNNTVVVVGCCILFIDEAQSASTGLEIFLAQIVSRTKEIVSLPFFRNHYISSQKSLNYVTVIAENY